VSEYGIRYRIEAADVLVLHVAHGHRDFAAILGP